ncbi:response regulator transcription factor [Armatimonas rosea]|uniref:DNA-binding response OmpR family regulator n=1 Tax=Armatimonas rosea TaxID=685828 RepID=A0A7W9SRM2_ARMRO|nr:response regulator transcription factor [Armatimonas rosea]MBB6051160.1 DNA-binding response OmpR family regulator [Armatimonas rosea]
MRVLVIEDDPAIASMLVAGLQDVPYTVDHASDGVRGLALLQEQDYHLIVLDVMLPDMSGWEVCERLRLRRNRTPVLMLSARNAVDDKIRGLDAGADDYLPKPFEFGELLARVRALLRRDRIHRTRTIQIADLRIDTAQRRVTRGEQEIGLSHREYELLEALASHEGVVLSRERIQETIWQNEGATSATVDVYIGLLRKKMDTGFAHKLIQTVHGAGYTLRAPHEEAV